MAILTDIVKQFFASNDWEYEQDPDDEGTFYSGVEAESGEFEVLVLVQNEINHLTCVCTCPDEVPEERYGDVAEYLARVNLNTMIGHFSMEYEDGTVYVRGGVNFADMVPTEKAVAILVGGTITTTDMFYPGLLAVIDGEMSPEEVLEDTETGGMSEDDEEEMDDEDEFEEE